MTFRLIRRFAFHRPTDAESVAGALLSRCHDPMKILDAVAGSHLTLRTKAFALRRIAITMQKSANLGFERDPRYAELVNSVLPLFNTVDSTSATHLLFWLRVSTEYRSNVLKQLKPKNLNELQDRVIDLQTTGVMATPALVPVMLEFARLGWSVDRLLPLLAKNITNESEIMSWEQVQMLMTAMEGLKHGKVRELIVKLNLRTSTMSAERADLRNLISIFNRADLMVRRRIGGSATEQMLDRCYQAIARKYHTASSYSMFLDLKNAIFYPYPPFLLASYLHSRFLASIRDSECSADTLRSAIVYCARLKYHQYYYPEEMLSKALERLGQCLKGVEVNEFNRLTIALHELGVSPGPELLQSLDETGRALKPGPWVVALWRLGLPCSFEQVASTALACDLSLQVQILSLLHGLPEEHCQSLRRELLSSILRSRRHDHTLFLVQTLLAINHRAESSIHTTLYQLCDAVIEQILQARASLSFAELRLLIACYQSHKEKVVKVTEVRRAEVIHTTIDSFTQSIPYNTKIDDFIKVVERLCGKLTLEAVVRIMRIAPFAGNSYTGDLFRRLLNNSEAMTHCMDIEALEELFLIVDHRPQDCSRFLQSAANFLRRSRVFQTEHFKLAEKVAKHVPDALSAILPAVANAVKNPSVSNPEVLVKLLEGQCAAFDSQLPELTVECSKYEIKDKCVAVRMRNSQQLSQKLMENLRKVCERLPTDTVARVLETLSREKGVNEAKNALLEKVAADIEDNKIVSEATALAVLRAMRDLGKFQQRAFDCALAVLRTSRGVFSPAAAIDCMSLLGTYGTAGDLISNLLECVGMRYEDFPYYAPQILQAAHQLNALGTIRKYAIGYLSSLGDWKNNRSIVPTAVIVPLLRSEAPSAEEKQRLLALLSQRAGTLDTTTAQVLSLLTAHGSDAPVLQSFVTEVCDTGESTEQIGSETAAVSIPVRKGLLGLASRRAKGDLAFIEEIYKKKGRSVTFLPSARSS